MVGTGAVVPDPGPVVADPVLVTPPTWPEVAGPGPPPPWLVAVAPVVAAAVWTVTATVAVPQSSRPLGSTTSQDRYWNRSWPAKPARGM